MVKSRFQKTLCVLTLMLFLLGALPLATQAENDPEKAKEMYNEGLKAANDGNNDQAILSYKAAIGLNPDFLDPYLNLGAIYFQQKKYDDAMDMFKKVSEKDPANIDAQANIGRVAYKLSKYPEAIAAFKAAIAVDGQNTDLHIELAKVYYRQKNYPELITTLEACHNLGGGDYLSYYMLGKGYQQQDKLDLAIGAFKKSLEFKGDNSNAHFAMGQIYLGQEKFKSAASSFKASFDADSKKHIAMYNYAIAMESQDPDAIDQNIKIWEDYIRIAKKHPKAQSDLAIAQQHVKELKDRKEKLELQ
ncbi:MAG: tetratricopeptide repeat protein [candidate division Zixibacteria bacterium]|nr:tetratricopeptide repeat protein [candidate division Zixibacteria bacterium]